MPIDKKRRAAELGSDAGLDAVHGPGLVVTLTDAQRDANGRFPRDASPDDLVVHQQDISAVLNAMWSAGAEAIHTSTDLPAMTPFLSVSGLCGLEQSPYSQHIYIVSDPID